MLLRKVIISPSNGWERTGVLGMLVIVLLLMTVVISPTSNG